jgi:hypothetical protein
VTLDGRHTNKFAPHNSTVIYHKPGHQLLYTPMTDEMKCPRIIPLPCAFHSNSSDVDATHVPTNHQIIWSNSYHHITILIHRSWPHLLFTIASVHRRQVFLKLYCHTRSLTSKHSTCPSHLQPVYRGKPHLDLLHLDHMTPYHVSYVMSSFMTQSLVDSITKIKQEPFTGPSTPTPTKTKNNKNT